LPKVTPPINLVDAILPQLEMIDRGITPESNEPAAARSGMREDADRSAAGLAARAARRRRWTDRFSLRAVSGVVAAGIVVGLFIITYEPPSAGDRDDAGQ